MVYNMENKVDIREIAQYCKNEYEQECEKSECKGAYSIVYAAITFEGKIKVSTTPHVLVDAERCYVIHSWAQKAVSCWYDTYAIQSVNADGEVRDGYFDEEYSFTIGNAGFNRAPCIYLNRNGRVLYSESFWREGELAKILEYIWGLYKKCKSECKTLYESQLLCRLAKKDKTIKELEENLANSTLKEQYLRSEISQYRELLDDIKSALKSDVK
jgi:hypothetical protein